MCKKFELLIKLSHYTRGSSELFEWRIKFPFSLISLIFISPLYHIDLLFVMILLHNYLVSFSTSKFFHPMNKFSTEQYRLYWKRTAILVYIGYLSAFVGKSPLYIWILSVYFHIRALCLSGLIEWSNDAQHVRLFPVLYFWCMILESQCRHIIK